MKFEAVILAKPLTELLIRPVSTSKTLKKTTHAIKDSSSPSKN